MYYIIVVLKCVEGTEGMALHFKACFLVSLDLECKIFAWFNTSSFMRLLYLHSAFRSLLQLSADRKVLYPVDVLTLSNDTSLLLLQSCEHTWLSIHLWLKTIHLHHLKQLWSVKELLLLSDLSLVCLLMHQNVFLIVSVASVLYVSNVCLLLFTENNI